ncbi:MAG: MFS transporter [Anaerolineaceae bacterium]|nr:MFS transporter [Anaerolineaceae bacterium]
MWFGQTISLIGTSMSSFALMIWVWKETGQATATVLTGISGLIPSLIVGLVTGVLIDRWDRKWVMLLSDLAAGVSTVIIFLLFSSQQLQVWHLYVTSAIAGAAGTFQYLAYSASITLMIPKSQYARASGLQSLSEYGSKIGAPIIAGILIGIIGVSGILLIDLVTFLFAATTLLLIHVPNPTQTPQAKATRGTFLQEAVIGFRAIFARPGLLGLLVILLSFTTAESLGYPLILPMILARTGNNELILGTVQSVLGIGGVIGAILLTIWGGPRRKVYGVLVGVALTSLLGDSLMGLGQSLPVWVIAAIFLEVFIPVLYGSYQAIWQAKIEPEIQGRVFAARDLMVHIAQPIAMILTGLLVDKLFEPALMPNGSLAPIFGGLVGTGSGAGMGLLLVIAGLLSALAGLAGFAISSIREVEIHLPDHQPVTESAAT